MGRLRHRSGREVRLLPTHRVGRDSSRDLVLESALATGEHATLCWVDEHWAIRDQGSSNGTFVSGRRIESGPWHVLMLHDRVTFGDRAEEWELTDDAPPATCAIRDDGLLVEAWAGAIVLPDPAAPLAVIRREGHGWVVTQGRRTGPGADRERLVLDGRTWTLHLPGEARTVIGEPADAAWGLTFVHFEEEERVALTLRLPDRHVDLGSYAHNRVLLVLAEERLRAERGELEPQDAGWLRPADLAQYSGTSLNWIYLKLHCARERLQKRGIADPDLLVQRDGARGAIRIGTSDLEIERK